MISGTRYRLTAEINRQVGLSREIASLQVQIATGKRIQTPSDDPTGAAIVSQLLRTEAQEGTWMRNLVIASTLSDRADNALASVTTNLERATEQLIAGAGDVLSARDRATYAQELRSIAADLAVIADTRDPNGEPLFSSGAARAIPVYSGGTIVPVASHADVFGAIATAGGPLDLVTILNNAADAIVEPDGATRQARTDAALDALQAASAHIAAARADQGLRANRIERLTEAFELSAISIEEQKGDIEGTDLTEAIARLQSKQLSLQAAQAVLSRLSQTSLFDMLR